MTSYHFDMTLGEAVKKYFVDNNFGDDGGYGDRWVEVKLGPIPVYLPNTPQRVRAVRYHDLHHVLSGYKTDLAGEFEISAWELASWCEDMYGAWWLNLGGLIGGLIAWPRRTVAAFLRGRRSRNLYRETYGPELLGQKVFEMRSRLGLDREVEGGMKAADWLALGGFVLIGIPVGLLSLAGAIVLLPVALIQNALRARRPVTPLS